jgi:hypothetical protein
MEDHLEIHLVLKIGSPKGDPPKGTSFNPPNESFGWLVFNPHMFMPPWYLPIIAQFIPK